MDQFYFEEGFVEAKYFVYIAESQIGLEPYVISGYLPQDFFEDKGSFYTLYCDAEIVVGMLMEAQAYTNSEFLFSASVSKSVDALATFNSEFTQSTIGLRDRDIDLYAFSDAAIAVEVSRIRDNNITASLVFDVAIDFVVQRSADTDVDAIFSAIINGLRSRDTITETQAAFSFDLNANSILDAVSTISSSCSIDVNVDRIRLFDSTSLSESTTSIDANRSRQTNIVLESQFDISILGRQIRDAHLTGTGIASLSCDPVKIAVANIDQQSSFSQTLLGGKLKTGIASFNVYFNIFVSRRIVNGRPRNLPIITDAYSYFDSSKKKFGTHSWHPKSGTSNFDRRLSNSPDNPATIRISTGESFVLESWFYFDTTVAALVSIRIAGIEAQLTASVSKMQAVVFDSNGNAAILSSDLQATGHSRQTWNHLAIVSDGSRISWYINGTRQYTSTSLPTNYFTSGIYIYNSAGGVWLDELSFWKGTTLGWNPSSTSITVPTSERSNDQYTQGLWHFNNDGLDDYTIIGETFTGNSDLTSVASVSASIGYIVRPVIAISSTSSLTAVIGTLEDINLTAFNSVSLSVDISVQRNGISNINSETSCSIQQDRLRDTNSSLSSEISISAVADRFRDTNSNISSNSTVSASVNVQTETEITINSIVSLSAVIGTLEDINLIAFTNGSLTIDAVKNVNGNSELSSLSTLNADVNVIADSSSDISCTSTLNADNYKVKFASSLINVNADISAIPVSFLGIISNINSIFVTKKTYFEVQGNYLESNYFEEFDIIAEKTAQGIVGIAAEFLLQASTGGSFFAQLISTSSASVTASAIKTASAVISSSSAFDQTTVAVKQVESSSSLSSEFNIFCNAVTAAEINMVAFSNANLSIIAEANKPFTANFTASSSIYAYTQDSLNANAESDISATFSQSIAAVKRVSAIISTDSIASSLIVAVKDVVTDIVFESQFVTSIQPVKVTDNIITAESIASSNISINRRAAGSAAIVSQSTLNVISTIVVDAVINTQIVASELSVVARIASFFINADINSTLQSSASIIRGNQSSIISTSTISVNIGIIKSANSQLQTSTSTSVLGGLIKGYSIVMSSAMTFVIAIRDIRIDEIEYKIPGEGWVYSIAGETRNHTILGETRLREILTETSLRTIAGETRIYIIE